MNFDSTQDRMDDATAADVRASTHSVEQGAQYCSCGQDAVTCQGCGRTVCGDAAAYTSYTVNIRAKYGNFGPSCLHLVRAMNK